MAVNIGNREAGRGGLEVKRLPGQPLAKLAEAWLERRKATPRSAGDAASRFKAWLTPFFGLGGVRAVYDRLIGEYVHDRW